MTDWHQLSFWPDAGYGEQPDLPFWNPQPSDPIVGCLHSWKEYEGFTEKYEFCERCNEKRETTK